MAIFKFKKEHLGEHGAYRGSFEYHTPTVIIIQSALWQSIVDDENEAITTDSLKLNFEVENTGSQSSTEITYTYKGQEKREGVVLSNIVPILNLRTADDEQGYQEKMGDILDRIWDKDSNKYKTETVQASHDPQLTNKRLGVIFYQNWYVAKETMQVKYRPKIYTVYSPDTLQTGGDIIQNIDRTDTDNNKNVGVLAHLLELAEEAKQVSQNSKDYAQNRLQEMQQKQMEQIDGSPVAMPSYQDDDSDK